MKKQLAAILLSCLIGTSVFANGTDTIAEKTDAMEKALYGHVQEGAIVDRVGQIELTLKGKESNTKLTDNVETLYASIVKNETNPTVETQVRVLQWTYDGKVSSDSILSVLDRLERAVFGRISKADVEQRVKKLSNILLGEDKKIVYKSASIPSDYVFKVKTLQPINTAKDVVGQTFTFAVAEDVMDGDVLVVAEGTEGIGTITELQKARSFGRKASITLAFDGIQTVSGTVFDAEQGEAAQERSRTEIEAAGASVAGVALLGPIGLVGGFFVKGKNIEYPAGQAFYVQPMVAIETEGVALSQVQNVREKGAMTSTESVKEVPKTEVKEETKTTATEKVEKESPKTSSVAPSEPVIVIKKN